MLDRKFEKEADCLARAWFTFLWILGIAVVILFGVYLKWHAPVSDYQRLNSLETRVQAIEERAGSCEVGPLE